jgi:2-polyprenyl-6-hydroxyphenyl methylase/3-demethylubiquinone-9 3-methyltransferase
VGSRLTRTVYPPYASFAGACQRGLQVVYPLASTTQPDPDGWRYGAGHPPSYPAFGRMRALLAVEQALALRPSRVLEVAAGGGGLASTLAKRGASVVANDLLTDALTAALREYDGGDRVTVTGGSLFDLSRETLGTFDLVIACEVIEHVARPGDLLARLATLLTPGGRLLVTTPNGAHFRNTLPTLREAGDVAEMERRQFKPDADGHLFLLTPDELADLADGAGLRVERLDTWGLPPLTGHAGWRLLAGTWAMAPAYWADRAGQYLPGPLRVRLATAMSAVLTRD